ncbi:glutaminyl-peptide cyclotransferase [Croceitalea rosinachiae]|uniref:Glutaminyl-peptide cyclotransferase n=1 Tax=Croceitalea rosinachiae TaxID=3075596 RepID=A0ABU3ABM6_9FLAO|nr:glutaminyl-peptide cyclotransferase [Croceitalea sp. F388]MDT0607308.1 glutaminyl-peptide cyclotransferase [Croceitalea sp. F388]
MKVYVLLIAIVLVGACAGTNDATQLFDIQLEGNKNKYKQNQSVGIAIKNKKNKTIDAIEYRIDGKVLPKIDKKITFDIQSLGSKKLIAKIDFDDTSVEISKNIKVLSSKAPEIYTYNIINTYPHDDKAYTQGLEFSGDTLYESTGKKGKSTLRKVDYKTGEVLDNIQLDNSVFGEGITLMNNKIYQLTWQSGIGYVYDQTSFDKIESFTYGKSKEGWGLGNDGEKIFKSDGTEKIWYLDPETLVETGYVEIVTNKSIFNRANELEYVDGKLYANVYGKESMMIIDATSGAIEGVINFGGLKKLVDKSVEDWDEQNSVLNGVAYHPTKKTFFVTGKNWNKLFEVEILKKE